MMFVKWRHIYYDLVNDCIMGAFLARFFEFSWSHAFIDLSKGVCLS